MNWLLHKVPVPGATQTLWPSTGLKVTHQSFSFYTRIITLRQEWEKDLRT